MKETVKYYLTLADFVDDSDLKMYVAQRMPAYIPLFLVNDESSYMEFFWRNSEDFASKKAELWVCGLDDVAARESRPQSPG